MVFPQFQHLPPVVLSLMQTGFLKSSGTVSVHSYIQILKAFGSFHVTETHLKVSQDYAKDWLET
jgi:hypothetical protein